MIRLGAIYKSPGAGRRMCLDGTFSDANGRGACTKHGGLAITVKRRKAKLKQKAASTAIRRKAAPKAKAAPAPSKRRRKDPFAVYPFAREVYMMLGNGQQLDTQEAFKGPSKIQPVIEKELISSISEKAKGDKGKAVQEDMMAFINRVSRNAAKQLVKSYIEASTGQTTLEAFRQRVKSSVEAAKRVTWEAFEKGNDYMYYASAPTPAPSSEMTAPKAKAAPAAVLAPSAAMVPKRAPMPISAKDFRYFFHKRYPWGPIPKGSVTLNLKKERMYIRFEPQKNERDERHFERETLAFFKKKGFKLNEKTGLWERKISPKKPILANKIIEFTNEQLGTKIPLLPIPEEGNPALGAIVTKSTAFTQCADGTYSTAKKYPCRTRGGVAKVQKAFMGRRGGATDACLSKYGFKYADTYLVPLDQITTDEKRFQNRFTAFSSDSAGKIVAAVEQGRFNWGLFDPVILLKNPAYPKYVVLSGHSRTAAFRKLAQQKRKANGQGFAAIPAKIIETDLDTAREIALNSNTLATPESVIERAAYYRSLIERGTPREEVKKKVQATELKNWTLVWSLTYLNPRGKTMAALNALQGKDLTSNKNLEVIASWIGQTREAMPELSDFHENEMFDFLRMEYGKSFSNLREFQQKVRTIIAQRQTMFETFKPDTPLNLFATTSKSSYQLEYEARERDLINKVRELDKEIKRKRTTLVQRLKGQGLSETQRRAELDRILAPLESALKTQQIKLAELQRTKGDVLKAERSAPALFGITPRHHRKHI